MSDELAPAPYQSLYRRYRPQRFDEVRGQDHVTRALKNAVRDHKVAHAYLFSGPRGTGKTSTARILALIALIVAVCSLFITTFPLLPLAVILLAIAFLV